MTAPDTEHCHHDGALDVHLRPGATGVLDVESYTCEDCGEPVELFDLGDAQ